MSKIMINKIKKKNKKTKKNRKMTKNKSRK